MLIAIKVDNAHHDAAIRANVASSELALVTLDTGTSRSHSRNENETVTLGVEEARELAKALISVADAVEFVRTNEFALP